MFPARCRRGTDLVPVAPDEPVEPLRRPGGAPRVALRTLHIICFSLLFGGHWFGVPGPELLPWLYASVFTGAGLMALEAWGRPDWFAQLAGGFTMLKLALLCLVPVFPAHDRTLLLLAIIVSSIGSHMPARFRHFNYIKFRETWNE